MKLEEAKVGMRVGLCRVACRKHGWSKFDVEYAEKRYAPGLIVHTSPRTEFITIAGPNGDRCDIHYSILIVDN